MAAPSKQYGLIFPKKMQQKTLVKHAVFMDDSDEESSVGESLQKEALKKQAMKQTKLEIQRALAEDATVYEYDNIYEDIQQKKVESHGSLLAGKGEKKPKYIQNILKAAELRKKEQEKRVEKKIQKEREMEGGAFDDKEAFVTSAYKKRLQERAEEEERERREAAVEACLDVTKQKDLSGFYRHLLNQTVGEEETPLCSLRGARLQEEPGVILGGSKEAKKTQNEGGKPRLLAQKDNPDADSDPGAESSEGESRAQGQVSRSSDGGKESRAAHADRRKRPKSRRDSRSSSEERRHRPKGPAGRPEREEDRKEKSGHRRERDRDGRPRGHGKEGRSRSEERLRRRQEEEEEERQKKKDRKERDDYKRDLRKWKDREDKYLEWEQQEKEEETNHRDQRREKETGGRGERREGKHGAPPSPGKDGCQAGKESPSDSEQSPELKHEAPAERTEQEEKPPAPQNKFAKRSSQESITSARDRYLARQVARVGSKPYVEEEED